MLKNTQRLQFQIHGIIYHPDSTNEISIIKELKHVVSYLNQFDIFQFIEKPIVLDYDSKNPPLMDIDEIKQLLKDDSVVRLCMLDIYGPDPFKHLDDNIIFASINYLPKQHFYGKYSLPPLHKLYAFIFVKAMAYLYINELFNVGHEANCPFAGKSIDLFPNTSRPCQFCESIFDTNDNIVHHILSLMTQLVQEANQSIKADSVKESSKNNNTSQQTPQPVSEDIDEPQPVSEGTDEPQPYSIDATKKETLATLEPDTDDTLETETVSEKQKKGKKKIDEKLPPDDDDDFVDEEEAEEQTPLPGYKPDISPVTIDEKFKPGSRADLTEKIEDSLDHAKYADLFADLINNPETQTPLTIGLGAAWGRGKTHLSKLIRDRISNQNENLKYVWFNAWEYSKAGNIWIHFYSKILKSLNINTNWLKRLSFAYDLFLKKKPQTGKFYVPVLIAILLAFDIVGLTYIFYKPIWSILNYTFVPTLYSISSLGAIGSITAAWKALKPISKQILPRLSLAGFDKKFASQEEILSNIAHLREWRNKGENCNERVVVFVDDIDRCKPDEIIGILEALQLFLEENNIIFILAMDTKIVRQAVGTQYSFIEDVNPEEMGRKYLEKIIQIPFRIPQPSKTMFMEYASTLFNEDIKKAIKISKTAKDQIPPQDGIKKTGDEAVTHKPDKPDKPVEEKPPVDEKEEEIIVGSEEYKEKLEEAEEVAESDSEQAEEMRRETVAVSKSEWLIVGQILKEETFTLSPRLMKRFSNIYFLSRNLILSKGTNLTADLLNSYIAWMAISIKYPEDSKLFFEWLRHENWPNLIQNHKDYEFIYENTSNDNLTYGIEIAELPKEEFIDKCNTAKLRAIVNLYIDKYHIDAHHLKITGAVFNCFNLQID